MALQVPGLLWMAEQDWGKQPARVAWPAQGDSAVPAVRGLTAGGAAGDTRSLWRHVLPPEPRSRVPPPPACAGPTRPPSTTPSGQASGLAWPSCAVLGSRGVCPSPPRVCTSMLPDASLSAPPAHLQPSAASPVLTCCLADVCLPAETLSPPVALLSLLGPVPGTELAASVG